MQANSTVEGIPHKRTMNIKRPKTVFLIKQQD